MYFLFHFILVVGLNLNLYITPNDKLSLLFNSTAKKS